MLLFILILITVAILVEYWTREHALDGVTAEQFPQKRLAAPDEDLILVTRLDNHSRRIIPFVRILDNPPTSLHDERIDHLARAGSEWVIPEGKEPRVCSTYLLPKQRWERKEEVRLQERGRYIFHGPTLKGGDFLGFREIQRSYHQFEEVVVMPKCSEDHKALTALAGFFGDHSVRRFIFEDPVLTLGVREYTGREPQKMISWPRSAQLGRLMVKNYDYTVEESIDVILNVDRPREFGSPSQLEECFSLARSVCEMLEEKMIRYRFLTNASAAGAMGIWQRVGDGLGQEHLNPILEGLGRATYQSNYSGSVLMKKVADQAETGRSHVLITPVLFPELEQGVRALERLSGSKVLVLMPQPKEGKEASN